MSTQKITLHVEITDCRLAGHIEHTDGSMPLTEDQFQILVEALAETAMPADYILRDFLARRTSQNGARA